MFKKSNTSRGAPLSLLSFLSTSLLERFRHLQVFNEEIAPIKGAALAVKVSTKDRHKMEG